MFTETQTNEMFRLQDKFNTELSPTWKTDGNDWGLAIAMEASEAIDHLGWKWWKHQEPDFEQAKIELVDIWHFFISYLISEYSQSLSPVKLIKNTYEALNGNVICEIQPIDACKRVLRRLMMYSNDLVDLCFRLILAFIVSGMTGDEVYRMYISKNALNHLRQRHGYKDGSYIKDWSKAGYSEDNQALEEFFKHADLDKPNLFDDVSEYLERIYNDVRG